MLQVHVNKEELYVAAAKFELEELGNAENARNFMFKGLRFHPKSEYLYTEVNLKSYIHRMEVAQVVLVSVFSTGADVRGAVTQAFLSVGLVRRERRLQGQRP
jgi:hypothetical protein